jgi:F-type H+-transporting ATPase subunit b
MDLLTPHPGLIIWTIITFVVVLVVLKAKVWGPLLAALDER